MNLGGARPAVADPATRHRRGGLRRRTSGSSRLGYATRRRLTVAAFIGVPLLVQIIWIWRPAVQTIQWSFTRWDGFSERVWVGLANYERLFDDPVFSTALTNNIRWILGLVLVPIALGLPLAVALDRRLRFTRLYQGALYLPVVLSLVVVGLIWSWILQPDGLLNRGLQAVALDAAARPWLADDSTALWAVLGAGMWRQAGYVMMIYLAGLKALDTTYPDAAAVDGANPWQVFRHVTLPLLRPVHIIVIVITIIDSFRAFDLVWVMTRGGPFNSTELLAVYMYRSAVFNFRIGYGSAIAVVLFGVSLLFIMTYLVRTYRRIDDPVR